MKEIVVLILYGFIVLLLIRLSWTDIKQRIISNRIILYLFFPIIVLSLLRYEEIFVIPALTALIIGFVLFSFNAIGGGDVKLITVLMLSLPTEQILSFFLFTTFFGLLLIIIGWLFFKESIRNHGLPYGVAISLGFLTNLILFWQ